jgi:hypothetical protein
MICSESNLGPTYSIHYTIPDVEDKLEIFDGLSVNDYSFEIECPTNYVALCSHNNYRISASFNRTVPSSIYGTSQISQEVTHFFDSEELFELNLHLQKINLKENNVTKADSLTIDGHTDFNIASWGNGQTKQSTLGRIWIYVDSEQVDVSVHRVKKG